jgi:transketolase
MNILCMGGRVVGPAVARELVDTFLATKFSRTMRHVRRLGKVAALASTFGWERYVGLRGRMIGMHTFGASA